MPPEPNTVSLRQQRLEEEVLNFLKAVDAGQTPDRQEMLARHPEMAADLKAFFADQDGIQSAVGQLRGQPAEPPAAFSRRIFGNYELLKVIGEGGMGIVFKARQFSPPRVVVLKMIRAGQLASPEDVQRFRTEAELAARLDHPSIVPIYEVGEHDGLPYFTMKRIEGGSLAQHLRLFVNSPKASARLVAKVARAVHHAHQRGILHRDLKPANILLDGRGKPHVTDFGLAKLLQGDAGLTHTGAIVGTIGYMSPEQAAAKKDLTTAVDVYGLGAIFYELLTGQPLFRAETVIEMLRKVQEQEPKRPRVLKPRLDRDLETICLKCLEKNPTKRYGSAEALAQDLDHWLADEPIAGRRSSVLERALKWAKRRPAVAALLAVTSVALFAGIGLIAALWVYAEKAAAALKDLQTEQIKRNELLALLKRAETAEHLAAQVRAEWVREMERRARSLRVVRRDNNERAPVELLAKPLLHYDDPPRDVVEATLWAFGRTGRPVALVAMEFSPCPEGGAIGTYEFVSLSSGLLTAETAGAAWRWSPQGPGIELQTFPDAPAPAATDSGRLGQMKSLAQHLTAWENTGLEPHVPLLLLEEPIYRYADPAAGLQDGAIFVLAHGTNPEVALLIESSGARWRYGLARLTAAEISVSLDGREVWKDAAAKQPRDVYWDVAEPYFAKPGEITPGKK